LPGSARYDTLKVNFKTLKKIIRRSIVQAKKQYYHMTFKKYSNDLRKTWRTINETLNMKNKAKSFPQEFCMENGNIISDHKTIANAFNKFFTNIGETVITNTNTTISPFNTYLSNKPNCKFTFTLMSVEDIVQIINSLKPKVSSGLDELSNKMLKLIKDVIAPPLTIIINQMLNTGIFPDKLKISKVIPLFKKGDDKLFSNYRPISLLSSISKIFEKVIFNQVSKYFEINNLIFNNQYGFRKKYSTEIAALHLIDCLNFQMDQMKIPLNIFLDLSKAFDTLNHDILLSKLKHYGIDGISYNLFETYIRNRSQYVKFESENSNELDIKRGVPQGSILGPLLFIIYINDLPNASKVFDFLMYADDTTLSCCIDKLEQPERVNILNRELLNVNNWLISNELSLNINKTKYMIYYKHPKTVEELDIKINNNSISRVNSFNFLGLQINDNLTWNTHTEFVSKKISRITGLLYKMNSVFPKDVLLSMYNTLILPHINYCLLSWGKQNDSILLLQKKSLRAVCCAKYKSHSEPLFKECNVLKINHIYETKLLTFYHNMLHSNISNNFTNFLPKFSIGNTRYPIRSPKYLLPTYKHEYIKLTCRYQIPLILNSYMLPDHDITSYMSDLLQNVEHIPLKLFKRNVKTYFLSTYSEICKITHCYICQRSDHVFVNASR